MLDPMLAGLPAGSVTQALGASPTDASLVVAHRLSGMQFSKAKPTILAYTPDSPCIRAPLRRSTQR